MMWARAVVASSLAAAIALSCTAFSSNDNPSDAPDAASDGSVAPTGDSADGGVDASVRALHPLWVKTFGSASQGGATLQLNGTAFNAGGAMALAGTFDAPTSFGGPEIPGYVSKDAFVVVLDNAGEYIAATSYGGSYEQDGLAIASDVSGGIWATFRFQGSITFDFAGTVDAGTSAFGGAIAKMTRVDNTLQAASVIGATGAGDIAVRRLSAQPGSVIVYGDWTKELNLGGNTWSDPTGRRHLFVTRIPSTSPVVTGFCGGGADCTAGASAIAKNADVVLTGRFSGTWDLGTGGEVVAPTDDDAFVLRLDSELNPLWVSSLSGAGAQVATAAAAIPDSNDVIVAGTFDGTLGNGNGAPQSAGGKDIFVSRWTDGGKIVWTKTFGGNADDVVTDVAVDSLGGVFLATHFASGSIDFGGGALFNQDTRGLGTTDVALVWLDAADGSHVWSARYGGSGTELTTGIGVATLTGGEAVTIAGTFDGTTDLATGAVPMKGKRDIFIARFTR
jgi:hypothetical protein